MQLSHFLLLILISPHLLFAVIICCNWHLKWPKSHILDLRAACYRQSNFAYIGTILHIELDPAGPHFSLFKHSHNYQFAGCIDHNYYHTHSNNYNYLIHHWHHITQLKIHRTSWHFQKVFFVLPQFIHQSGPCYKSKPSFSFFSSFHLFMTQSFSSKHFKLSAHETHSFLSFQHCF